MKAVKRDVDSHISLSKAVIQGFKVNQTPKISYRSHKFYLSLPKVVATVAIEFMDNKEQKGKAEYDQ